MRHRYVRYDRTAGEQCLKVTPLGVASGARWRFCAAAWLHTTSGWAGAERTEWLKGPADMDGSVVAVAVTALAAAVLTEAVATAAATAAPTSAGAAAVREESVSKTGDAGCVGNSAMGWEV